MSFKTQMKQCLELRIGTKLVRITVRSMSRKAHEMPWESNVCLVLQSALALGTLFAVRLVSN